jgi:opacity protein-like surface antigen
MIFLIYSLTLGSTAVFGKTILTVSGGVGISDHVGKSQTLSIENSEFTYKARHHNETVGLMGIFLGTELAFNHSSGVQIGMGYYHPFVLSTKGMVTQSINSKSPGQFSYRYHLRSEQLFVESKWFYNWQKRYHPYLSLALGASFNNSCNYDAKVPTCRCFSPQFSDHHVASFSYSAGLGVDVDVRRHIRVGMGYCFVDLGRFKLGNPVDTASNPHSLSQSISQIENCWYKTYSKTAAILVGCFLFRIRFYKLR